MHISRPGGIEPFYFGATVKTLLGCYHPPQSGRHRDCGVVLCSPMGHEYIQSHRAFRQLAVRLSSVGFHVLRFDYYGCGDSSGDWEQGEICQWMDDISTAIDEIRSRMGFVKVCLVGLRLGATLSMMVGAERGDIENLALWDAVVSGRAYLEELVALHNEKFRFLRAKSKTRVTGEGLAEMVGFALTDSMRRELGQMDLLAIQRKPANNILLIESGEQAGEERFRKHLESMNVRLTYRRIPDFQTWREAAHKVLTPNQILQALVSWISEAST